MKVIAIELTQGKVALIDKEDHDLVSQFKWCAKKCRNQWYAFTATTRDGFYMHRLLLPNAKQVDHWDGDGLNNCRCNLREANWSQNQANRLRPHRLNTSGYRGVTIHKRTGKWHAQLGYGKGSHLGSFTDPKDAALAYNAAAIRKWGPFARINDI
jgi:hypothetical protein